MKIAVLGSGDVAKALASGFIKKNHQVTMGTGNPEKLSAWAVEHPTAQIGSFADAANFGEIIILAVRGSGAHDVLHAAGEKNLAKKIVIDVTNPIADEPPVNGVLKYFTTHDQSLMEQSQKKFASARFVKAFNSVGHALMVDPPTKNGKPTMFLCGNDEAAKKTVSDIIASFGWEACDMGKMEAARAIEPLAMLWCIPGFLYNDWNHAFKLLDMKD